MLKSAVACQEFLYNNDATAIAYQIRRDEAACKTGRLPSLLALHLKALTPVQVDQTASQLCPETAKYSRAMKIAQYSGIVGSIKAYLKHMTYENRLENLPSRKTEEESLKPSMQDFETALKVLRFMKDQKSYNSTTSAPLGEVITNLQKLLEESKIDYIPQVPLEISIQKAALGRNCYICQFLIKAPHPQYESLCIPCGAFNLASSDLSLPPNFQLNGRTALVTGARIHLGFHTALRLLRSGAKVIVSSRYPHDASRRYIIEADADNWRDSLRIIGADFRAASDVFQLVETVKIVLKEWDPDGPGKLDILINNAAQTWTDPVEKELKAIDNEDQLLLEEPHSLSLVCTTNYTPRVRGGTQDSEPLITLSQLRRQIANVIYDVSGRAGNGVVNLSDISSTLFTIDNAKEKCSWFQNIHEIPYEDIVSAHSVNTFVPLILIRELLPLMGTTRSENPLPLSTMPRAYIVNVSAREGIFERTPKSKHKNGKHVHTNLTKAALNMLTETEAWPAWRERRVAMNSVDPGYLSMPLDMEEKGLKCPIGWEDGAGRVLWPIAVGEKGEGVYGRFLKDYGFHEVDVGIGR